MAAGGAAALVASVLHKKQEAPPSPSVPLATLPPGEERARELAARGIADQPSDTQRRYRQAELLRAEQAVQAHQALVTRLAEAVANADNSAAGLAATPPGPDLEEELARARERLDRERERLSRLRAASGLAR